MNKDPFLMKVRRNGWTSFGAEPVEESMNLPGALRLGTTSGSNAGTMRWTGIDFEGYDGSSWNSLTTSEGLAGGEAGHTLRHDGMGWVADSFLVNAGTNLSFGENFKITDEGNFEGYSNGVLTSKLENLTYGSKYTFYDSEGYSACVLKAHDNTTGAYLSMYGGQFCQLYAGSSPEGSSIYISGPETVVNLNTAISGNNAVNLGTDAVSAYEILDEPGIASIWSTGSGPTLYIYDTWTVLASKTITAPADGYILTVASCCINLNGDNGVLLTINDTPNGVSPIITYKFSMDSNCISFHDLFPVAAGEHTFYLLGAGGTAEYPRPYCGNRRFTAIYFPTSYGTVEEALTADGRISEADIEAERKASIDANNARIEQELAEMRAQIKVLRAKLENSNR